MFCPLCPNKGGFVAGHGSLPPRKERTERAQRRCSCAGECRAGHPWHVTVPDIYTCCTIKSINGTYCWCARASHGFLTNASVIGGNCTDFLITKFLFKELQVTSVKLSDTHCHCHHGFQLLCRTSVENSRLQNRKVATLLTAFSAKAGGED